MHGSADLERDIREHYQGKIFLVRGFYSGTRLTYASNGLPDRTESGDWTSYGFVRLKEIRCSKSHLTIKAIRQLVVVANSKKLFQFESEDYANNSKKNAKYSPFLEIQVALDSDTSFDAVDAALSKVFLTSHDGLEDLVPDYWKPCVHDAVTGNNVGCHFSREFMLVPGCTSPGANHDPALPPAASTAPEPDTLKLADSQGATRIPKNVRPPKVIEQRDPRFSEPARLIKFQGTVTLAVRVDKDGLPTRIRIVSPLGAGLDENAVRAVENWRFRPAEKDGEPFPTEVMIELDFHLY